MDWRDLYRRQLGYSQRPGGELRESHARKLDIAAVLAGHTGCVNRLAWSTDGSLLASASDDCQVLLWHYPDTSRVPLALQTEHRANLFGVALLPFSNNTRVVTGAMDYTVQLHEIGEGAFGISPKYRSSSSSGANGSSSSSRGGGGGVAAAAAAQHMRRHPPSPQVHTVVPRTTVFHCHKSRVKEVEVCLADPALFWSAGEDGVVRQYDTRAPTHKAYGSPNVLVNLMNAGPSGGLVECKGLAINQQNPHLLGVACGDPYVRLFDRRKLSTCRPGAAPTPPLLSLTAPHLPLELAAGLVRRCHATHCSFSHRGDKLVASFHADHAYVFDVTQPHASATAAAAAATQLGGGGSGGGCGGCGQRQQQQQRVRRRVQQDHAFVGPAAVAAHVSTPPQQQQQQQQQHQLPRPSDLPTIPYNSSSGSSLNRDSAGTAAAAAAGDGDAGAAANNQNSNNTTLPETADAEKVLGNNALFEQSYSAAISHFTAAIAAAPTAAPGLYTQRALALLKRGWEGDAAYALRDCETAVALVQQQQQQHQQQQQGRNGGGSSSGGCGSNGGGGSNGSSSVEQQARLRLVHALKQLGQVKCALAALSSYTSLYPAAAGGSEVAALDKFLQEHLSRRLGYKRKLAAESRLRAAAQRQQQQQQQQQQEQQEASPTAAAAAGAAAAESGDGDGNSSSSRSESESPLGGQQQQQVGEGQQPPGPGFRVDTDVDSEDLEGGGEQGLAAAAAAGGGEEGLAAAAAEGFVLEGSGGDGGSAAAAAAAAMDVDGAAAANAAGSGTTTASQGEQQQQQPSLPTPPPPPHQQQQQQQEEVVDEFELLQDELLAPWYGPTATPAGSNSNSNSNTAAAAAGGDGGDGGGAAAGGGATTAAGAAAAGGGAHSIGQQQQQQQQQQGTSTIGAGGGGSSSPSSSNSSRRRRPRSSSCDIDVTDAAVDAENVTLFDDDSCRQQQPHWWDAMVGGRGRLLQRCVGHCNVQTDIKEAVFLGQDDSLVACGSDDGYVFIYDAQTGTPVKVLAADEDVANCVQPHPHLPVLATSGIDTVVRLWSPTAPADMRSCESVVVDNQARMRDGPRSLRGGLLPPHVLQAALGDNPQLLQLLIQQLYGAGVPTPAAAGAAATGGGGGGGAAAAAGTTAAGTTAAAAGVGARGSGAASEGSPRRRPQQQQQGIATVGAQGLQIIGLNPAAADEDDDDEDDEFEEDDGSFDFGSDEGGSGGEGGGQGRGGGGGQQQGRRRRGGPRRQQEVTCRVS